MKSSQSPPLGTKIKSADQNEATVAVAFYQPELFNFNGINNITDRRKVPKNRSDTSRVRAPNYLACSTHSEQLELVGYLLNEGMDGVIQVSKNGQSFFCDDFEHFKAYAEQFGVSQLELF